MAGLAKSPRESKVTVIHVKDKKDFIKQFNEARPNKEFFESCRKAGELFGIKEVSYIDTDDDFYCGYAERRTDDGD